MVSRNLADTTAAELERQVTLPTRSQVGGPPPSRVPPPHLPPPQRAPSAVSRAPVDA